MRIDRDVFDMIVSRDIELASDLLEEFASAEQSNSIEGEFVELYVLYEGTERYFVVATENEEELSIETYGVRIDAEEAYNEICDNIYERHAAEEEDDDYEDDEDDEDLDDDFSDDELED